MQNLGTDLTLRLQQDRPGALANVAEALAQAGLNIDGYAEIEGIVHLLTKDAAVARRALEKAGIPVESEQQVLVVEVENHVGAAAHTLRRIADAEVNVHFSYVAANNRLVLGVKNVHKAAELQLGRRLTGA